MRDDEDHPIVREYVRSEPIMPAWLWVALIAVAAIIVVVAF